MTVAELIAKLQALPQDLPVITFTDNLEIEQLVIAPELTAAFSFSRGTGGLMIGEPSRAEIARGAGNSFRAVAIGVEL